MGFQQERKSYCLCWAATRHRCEDSYKLNTKNSVLYLQNFTIKVLKRLGFQIDDKRIDAIFKKKKKKKKKEKKKHGLGGRGVAAGAAASGARSTGALCLSPSPLTLQLCAAQYCLWTFFFRISSPQSLKALQTYMLMSIPAIISSSSSSYDQSRAAFGSLQFC